METMPSKRHITQTIKLSLPLIISQIAVVAMTFVDTVMAGRLGSVTLAAVAVGSSLWATAILFLFGILMAIPPVISEMHGAEKHHKIAPFFRQALWLAFILGVIFTGVLLLLEPLFQLFNTQAEVIPEATGYLRALAWGVLPLSLFVTFRYLADGLSITKTTMYVSFLGLALNIPLNYILMFGKLGLPALGARGCGYATAIVLMVQMLSYIVIVFKHKIIRRYEVLKHFERPDWTEIIRFFKLGFPIGVSMFAEVGFFSVITLLASSLATETVAAHQIALNFSSLLFMVPLGLSMGITIRVGNAVGRANPIDIKNAGFIGIGMVLFTQLFSGTITILFASLIVSLYTNDVAVGAIAVSLLFYAAVFQLSDGIQVASAGALRGIKDMNFIMFSNIFSFWLLGFVASWYLCFELDMGAEGLWIGIIVGLTAAAILNTSRFYLKTKATSIS
ncbi:MAG: MATE family efflux transporter [Xanthomonadales bacterium]|nr:MATE family efflux transporter [Xanthomonadales bacterium]